MELLRQAVGNYWSKPAGYDSVNMTRQVSEEEWKAQDDKFFNDLSDGFMLIETPKDDMVIIEQLLQVKAGFFPTSAVIKTRQKCCLKCGRENNFLDVVATGLRVHKPQFLIDVFSGKYGWILNTHQNQKCICYQCGEELPEAAAKYSAPNMGEQRSYYRWIWSF
ncbi:unnamed protein product [Didymodactylos carnosus]|uniref:Uncharacterized protein n=2 Tax=Didymodactylos carnosus TaxID=1234261 RepID=A0A8S2HGF6_9BILA|nr:unnamed protein product [Didymodactylos carnosus]CAF3641367.1 unnamed protein product [Didymodactylos carnosus]